MPPKEKTKPKAKAAPTVKGKKGKRKEELTTELEPEPEEQLQFSDDEKDGKELDLLADLNDAFFAVANKTIQKIMATNRIYEASKIKEYVGIIYNLHRRYVDSVKEVDELRPETIRAETKLRLALQLTSNSQEDMECLREALGEAWRESDASLLREQDVQEKMQGILLKCEHFKSKEAEKHDDSAEFGHLAKYKNIILRERDRVNGEVLDLEKRLQIQRYYSESLEYINKNHEDSINKISIRIRVLDTVKQNLEVKVRNLQVNLEDQRDINSKSLTKLESCNKELIDNIQKLQKKIVDFDQLKVVMEKVRSDNLASSRQLAKNEDEILGYRSELRENEETIKTLRLEDKVKLNIINQLNKKYKKAGQEHSSLSSKLYKLNRLNNTLSEDIIRQKNQINALEKDLLSSSYNVDEMRRIKDNVQHERDNLRSDIIKLTNQIADLRHTIMVQSNTMDSLRLDINKLNVKLDEAKIQISKAEKERDEMAQEVETLHERIEHYQEQFQLKSDQISDLTEKFQQKHFALINVKKQLELVHSEKMVLKRSLETCAQERDDFRILQTKTIHQTGQLTSEISMNQNKMNSLNLKIDRLNNEKKELQSELKNTENVLSSVRKNLKEIKTKNENLMKTIADDELKFMKISQELDETRKEKNLIGLQMVRRNDEIMLLKEKLCIMQTALDQGQTQYNQRVEDIRLLKIEITNLQTERECLSRAIKSTADMREEIIRLQRLLNQERITVRSLTEDAKTPTGVHRWRILKGEDPHKFQLLDKVQMLQRRNLREQIAKTKLEQKLEESKKICESLKRVVENLPTTDVKQKLIVTQRINRQQLKKLKALSAELAIGEIELKARECIIEEFKTTLKMTKQKISVNADAQSVSANSALQIYQNFSQDNCMDYPDGHMDCMLTSSEQRTDVKTTV